jgi:hypothetical protein
VIRPSLGTVLSLEDPYDYLKVDSPDRFVDLRSQFVHGPCLQLVSERSRPEAFLADDPIADPEHTDPGIVDIKVVKMGIIYRREARRMLYSKSNWKEWGAILTASQLYLFKDPSWLRGAILTQNSSGSVGSLRRATTSIVRAPIDGFHPSAVLPINDMVALMSTNLDASSSQKYAFLLGSRGGTQDWFAASSEDDMNDWMMKINFAASFNTYHVGIHGMTDERARRGSSISVESGDLETPPDIQEHALRMVLVDQKLQQIVMKLSELEQQVEDNIRTGRHLKLLAPIQQRTRETVIYAAGRLAAKLDWHWLEKKRIMCYRDFFVLERQVEMDLCRQNGACGTDMTEVDLAELGQSIRTGSVLSVASIAAASIITSKTGDNGLESPQSLVAGESMSLRLPVSPKSGDMGTRSLSISSSFSETEAKSKHLSPSSSNPQDNSSPPLVLPRKGMPLSLRDGVSKRNNSVQEKTVEKAAPQRSGSLMRKTDDFTLHGKKFKVVEVNPEFAASPNHQRSPSQVLEGTLDSASNPSMTEA